MPGFKSSEKRLTIFLVANAAGDFKLKSVLIYHSENPKAPENYTKSTLPGLCKWDSKIWLIAYLFTTWSMEYFLKYFLMLTIIKVFIKFVIVLFLFYVLFFFFFFVHKACGFLFPWPGT